MEPFLKASPMSSRSELFVDNPMSMLACVMVGLPARGKTYTARKIVRYLTWLGHRSRIFNVGNYRRKAVGAKQVADFFDPDNHVYNEQRGKVATEALMDMIAWLKKESNSITSPVESPKKLHRSKSICGAGVGGPTSVAVYDATNSSTDRRAEIYASCLREGIKVFFIENICDDPAVIESNIKEFKLSSPDYVDVTPEEAMKDFQNRIKNYEKYYETITQTELNNQIMYAKIMNKGKQIIVNNINGYLESRIVYFLMNLNTNSKSFFISRHGESLYNLCGKIGGDSNLSPAGELFAKELPEVLRKASNDAKMVIWTSTLKRTIQTAAELPHQKLQWKQLNELSSGSCDGLTYEEIEEQFPRDFAERDNDKFNYRYHGGESYRDLVHRLEPVILELERHNDPDLTICIIAHQAVVRAIYAYFHGISHAELPYIRIPLHTLIKLTPKAYNCLEDRVSVDIPAVDTFRPKVEH